MLLVYMFDMPLALYDAWTHDTVHVLLKRHSIKFILSMYMIPVKSDDTWSCFRCCCGGLHLMCRCPCPLSWCGKQD